jgi:hypothetical protein
MYFEAGEILDLQCLAGNKTTLAQPFAVVKLDMERLDDTCRNKSDDVAYSIWGDGIYLPLHRL